MSVGWFVINLERSPDRCAVMGAMLGDLGIVWQRVPAVDGAKLPAAIPGVDFQRYWRVHGRELRAPDIGCYLSHLRAVSAFLDSDHAFGMVLEDDAVITPQAAALADALTRPGAPDDWDLVKFEGHRLNAHFPLRKLDGGYALSALPTRPTGAAAYLINRKAADALLRGLLPLEVPYDHAFDRGWALGLRVRSVTPYPVITRASHSTISTPGNRARKAKVWEKLPTLTWRAQTETMRFVTALVAYGFPKRTFQSGRVTGSRDLAKAVAAAIEPYT